MKRFIRRLLYFLIPVPVFLLFSFIYYLIQAERVEAEFTKISGYETLLMGDSQLQRINPALFENRTYNFASSAEHYYFTYQKLERLLSIKDHNIRQVILGLSVHNFAPVYNRLFDLEQPEGKSSLAKYFYFLDLEDHAEWIEDDLEVKAMVKAVLGKPEWGGFEQSVNESPKSEIINKTFNMHYRQGDDGDALATEQQLYLNRIDSLCKANDVSLVLISTPYHPLYKKKIDPAYFDYFAKILQMMPKKAHINYLDFKIKPELMSDANHLNKKGATLFTNMIVNELKRMKAKKQLP
jgi:hypothetical protein